MQRVNTYNLTVGNEPKSSEIAETSARIDGQIRIHRTIHDKADLIDIDSRITKEKRKTKGGNPERTRTYR